MADLDPITGTVTADTSGFTAAMNGLQDSTKEATDNMGEGFSALSEILDIGLTTSLTALAAEAVSSFKEASQGSALLTQEIQNTGDACGWSVTQLDAMANNLSTVSEFGKEDILDNVTASLLKFGNISGQVFADAQQDIVGLASSGIPQFSSLAAAANAVGRALQNPTMGLRLLQEAGISIIGPQKTLLDQMVASGDTMGAQKIIIGLLNAKYGEMAQQMKGLPTEQLTKDMDEFKEALIPIGGIVLSALLPIVNVVANLAVGFSKLPRPVQEFAVGAVALYTALGPAASLLEGLGGKIIGNVVTAMVNLNKVIGTLITLFTDVVLPIMPFVLALGAVVVAGQLVYDNWNTIKAEGKVIWGAIAGFVEEAVAQILEVLSKIPGMGTMFISTIQNMKAAAATNFQDMNANIATVTQSTGSFSQSFQNLGNEINTGVTKVKSYFTGMTSSVKGSLEAVGQANTKTTDGINQAWQAIVGQLPTLVQGMNKQISSSMNDMLSTVESGIEGYGEDWQQTFSKILGGMLSTINQFAIDAITKALNVEQALNTLFTANPILGVGIIAGLLAATIAAGSILGAPPKMAMGGIISSPTTVLAGEAGPEAILPVVRLPNGQMGVQTTGGTGGNSGGGGTTAPGTMGAGAGNNGVAYIQVNLDSKPILKAVSKASRTGRIVISPQSIRTQAIIP